MTASSRIRAQCRTVSASRDSSASGPRGSSSSPARRTLISTPRRYSPPAIAASSAGCTPGSRTGSAAMCGASTCCAGGGGGGVGWGGGGGGGRADTKKFVPPSNGDMTKVKVGIIGSRFQADCIAGAVRAVPDEAEVVAVASPTRGHRPSFAQRHAIPRSYTDYADLLRDRDVELISITAPNRLHAQITIDAAKAGKHVVCEKPLCLTLEEADAMIDACRRAGVLLLYAEELFFAPKYVKAKQLADEGAFGRVHLVKQGEKHSGPHSDWFWDVEQSGGGAVM